MLKEKDANIEIKKAVIYFNSKYSHNFYAIGESCFKYVKCICSKCKMPLNFSIGSTNGIGVYYFGIETLHFAIEKSYANYDFVHFKQFDNINYEKLSEIYSCDEMIIKQIIE